VDLSLVGSKRPGRAHALGGVLDEAAQPPAFYIIPLDSSGQRPFWAIWARHGDELKVAFYDAVDRRPNTSVRDASSWC
jgi:hypothetical protein